MFRIHIARNRQPMGEFTPEEVAEGLQNGKFLPTDLGWREPMPAWKPLSEFDNLPVIDLTPPPIEVDETIVPPKMPEPVVTEVEPAWERRMTLGMLPALFESVRQIFSTPGVVFRAMPTTGGLKSPLSFYIILATVSTWATLGYQVAAYQINPEMFSNMPKSATPAMVAWSQVLTFVMAPFLVALGAFLMGGIFHITLKMLGVSQAPFEATFRAFCYGGGAASIMQFIPIFGSYIALAVQIVILVIAFREVHRISTWQSAIATTVPILLCCGIFLGFLGLVMGLGMAAGSLK